jgi:hypothetical protein
MVARFGASCPTFQPKTSWSTTIIKHIRLLLIHFIISQWVYQMIIQAHLEIIMALDINRAANPFHHLPMGLPDDSPSSFGDHYASRCHAGLDGLAR